MFTLSMHRQRTIEVGNRRHLDKRMFARTQTMRKVNVVMLYFCILLFCGGVIATGLPEFKKLQLAEQELVEIKAQEAAIYAKADQQMREYRALEQDPQFLEIYGRDRLDLYKEGERIFRFSRDR